MGRPRGVVFKRNRNSVFANNRVTVGNTYVFLPSVEPDVESAGDELTAVHHSLDPGIRLGLIADLEKRATTNVEVFERVLTSADDASSLPIVRLAGLFTNFASARAIQEGHGAYNDLLLRERKLITDMIRRGYDVRILASLDIPVILSSWGYESSQLHYRLIDLLQQMRRLEGRHANLRFAIDTHNRLPGLFVIGSAIMVRSLIMTPGAGYSLTLYETDSVEIANATRTFDEAFRAASQLAANVQRMLHLDSREAYAREVLSSRLAAAGLSIELGL